jgi:hypothetical protein
VRFRCCLAASALVTLTTANGKGKGTGAKVLGDPPEAGRWLAVRMMGRILVDVATPTRFWRLQCETEDGRR